jgi:xylan 1,4-beta-xylosidase
MIRVFVWACILLTFTAAGEARAAARASATRVERLTIDARAPGRAFAHGWEEFFGSGRAVLALRAQYQDDLSLMKSATGIEYVRFHGLLDDDVGVVDDRTALFYNSRGRSRGDVYNFSYVDQIMDALQARGIRPFIELDFMPQRLARNPKALFGFWYHPNVSPPASYARWDALIEALARHLIARYGIAEVSQWYFEVWNEPNLDFWGGKPKQKTYFELYDHSARALKRVDPRLRIGGPATAQAAWVPAFLAHVAHAKVPIDFVSTHVYANDTSEDVFGTERRIARRDMVCLAMRKVHDQLERSSLPHLPLIFSEYNASYANEPDVTDTPYMGPWLASTIAQCDGLAAGMSYWTFSDVFEEGGVVRSPFYGGFGVIAEDEIPKPAFNAFLLLHKLGDIRLDRDAQSALVTRTRTGALAMALWNYSPPDGTGPHYTPPPATRTLRTFDITLRNIDPSAHVRLWRLDDQHGNAVSAFDAMGRPPWPTPAQVRTLKAAARLSPPQEMRLDQGRLQIEVPQHGLVLLQVGTR